MHETKVILAGPHDLPHVDVAELRERGWTEAMVRDLLGEPDQTVAVAHFFNYAGKRAYRLDRVEAAESTEEFRELFTRSAKRRRLSAEFTERVLESSRRLSVENLREGDQRPRATKEGPE